MTISLTWANYALIVSVCLAIYYLVVLLLYRKSVAPVPAIKISDISNALSDLSPQEMKITTHGNLDLFGEEMRVEELQSLDDDQDFTPDAQAFADEIQAYTSSCGGEVSKEDLMQNLRTIIQKYPSVISGDAHYELSQLIAVSSENNCSIHLSADELSELWNG